MPRGRRRATWWLWGGRKASGEVRSWGGGAPDSESLSSRLPREDRGDYNCLTRIFVDDTDQSDDCVTDLFLFVSRPSRHPDTNKDQAVTLLSDRSVSSDSSV